MQLQIIYLSSTIATLHHLPILWAQSLRDRLLSGSTGIFINHIKWKGNKQRKDKRWYNGFRKDSPAHIGRSDINQPLQDTSPRHMQHCFIESINYFHYHMDQLGHQQDDESIVHRDSSGNLGAANDHALTELWLLDSAWLIFVTSIKDFIAYFSRWRIASRRSTVLCKLQMHYEHPRVKVVSGNLARLLYIAFRESPFRQASESFRSS